MKIAIDLTSTQKNKTGIGRYMLGILIGLQKIDNEDRIIFATDRFFRYLNKEAILADAVTSISAEEWMDFMINRISDINMLKGDNLSAITFIVRNTENVRVDP